MRTAQPVLSENVTGAPAWCAPSAAARENVVLWHERDISFLSRAHDRPPTRLSASISLLAG